MHHITSIVMPHDTTVEVDGSLDAVTAYDLRRCMDAALRRRVRWVKLDLTRVTTADFDGVQGLRRCCDTAVAARMVLTLQGCSRAVLEALDTFEGRDARDRTKSRA